jgi:hypothetical protein
MTRRRHLPHCHLRRRPHACRGPGAPPLRGAFASQSYIGAGAEPLARLVCRCLVPAPPTLLSAGRVCPRHPLTVRVPHRRASQPMRPRRPAAWGEFGEDGERRRWPYQSCWTGLMAGTPLQRLAPPRFWRLHYCGNTTLRVTHNTKASLRAAGGRGRARLLGGVAGWQPGSAPLHATAAKMLKCCLSIEHDILCRQDCTVCHRPLPFRLTRPWLQRINIHHKSPRPRNFGPFFWHRDFPSSAPAPNLQHIGSQRTGTHSIRPPAQRLHPTVRRRSQRRAKRRGPTRRQNGRGAPG